MLLYRDNAPVIKIGRATVARIDTWKNTVFVMQDIRTTIIAQYDYIIIVLPTSYNASVF